jgi:hypothetical protein
MSDCGILLCMTPIMAGAPRKQETVLMRLTVSAKLYNYLNFLSRTTTMGASENDVALFLLTRQLEDMRQSENYGFDLSDPAD